MSLTRQSNERIRKDILDDVQLQIDERKGREAVLFSISHSYDDAAVADVLWIIITKYKQTSIIVALYEKSDNDSKGYVYTPLNDSFSSLPIIRETKPTWYAIELKDKPNRLFLNNNQISDACIQSLIK